MSLIEPSSVSVRECNKTASLIHCTCDRLDTVSKSSFDWYHKGVQVQQESQFYTAEVTGDAGSFTNHILKCFAFTLCYKPKFRFNFNFRI